MTVNYVKIPASASQTPWSGNIDGGGHYLYNANIYDAISPTPTISINPDSRLLLANGPTYSNLPVIDYSGFYNSSAWLSFDVSSGDDGTAIFKKFIGDHNQNKSIDANARQLYRVDGTTVIDYSVSTLLAPGPIPTVDWSGTPNSNASLSFNSFSSLELGYGTSLNLASGGGGGITGANNISANSFTGDGSGLTNIPPPSGLSSVAYSGLYTDLSTVPLSWSGSGAAYMQTDLDLNVHTFSDSSGYIRCMSTLYDNIGNALDLGISGQPWRALYVNSISDGTNVVFNVAAGQQTGGAATAGAVYTATEQGMLQTAYNCLRAFGMLS